MGSNHNNKEKVSSASIFLCLVPDSIYVAAGEKEEQVGGGELATRKKNDGGGGDQLRGGI